MASWAHAEFKRGTQSLAVVGGLGWAGGEYQYQPGADDRSPEAVERSAGKYLYYFRRESASGWGLI
jgi:hypothetical protein